MELTLYIPKPDELGFRQKMLSDPETMSYNAPWFPPDGCIDFPKEKWAEWYSMWVGRQPQRFFAYLKRTADGAFVGDVCFHYTQEQDWWDMEILICAPERGRGYGRQGLRLLADYAFSHGVKRLHNEFETTRDAAYRMHLAAGFEETGQKNGCYQLELTEERFRNNEN